MSPIALFLTVLALVATPRPASAQQDASSLGLRLARDPAVRAVLDMVRAGEPAVIDDQVALCQIPAPPFEEGARAAAFRERFERLGLANVRIDRVGNVIGERPGRAATPHLVVSAHLDTVFEAGTDVAVARNGRLLIGPAIGDNCRGLAVVLGVIRALNQSRIETPGRITFVGTVGEEALGDLRGVRHLLQAEPRDRVDRFVSIDGAGLGITHIAVGSHRYRVAFEGPGGHSYGSFGLASPIHALGRLIRKVADFDVPLDPRTTFNVGRIGGGTSINAIASDAWLELDLRSIDGAALGRLDTRFREAVDEALAEENARWTGRSRLQARVELVGRRPAGETPASAPIVRAAISVTEALGLPARLGSGSTDANLAISMRIPAITIEGGGAGSGAHTVGESFDPTDSWKGTERATLLTIALTQP